MSQAPTPSRAVGVVLGGGALTGALAGLATGLCDALWSWSAASQFLPDVLPRVRFALFSALTYALLGFAIGLVVAAAALPLVRASRWRGIWQFALRGTSRDPTAPAAGGSWVPWVSYTIAIGLTGGLATVLVTRTITPFVTGRKELGLAALVAFGAGVLAVLAATWATLVIGHQLERLFRRAPRPCVANTRPAAATALAAATVLCGGVALFAGYRVVVLFAVGRNDPAMAPVVLVALAVAAGAIVVGAAAALGLGRVLERILPQPILTRPFAPVIAAVGLLSVAVIAVLSLHWETARLLPLRVPAVLAVGAAMAARTVRPGLALSIRWSDRTASLRRVGWVAFPIAVFALVLALGGSDAVIKAAARYTGVGGPLTRTLRAPFDFDRDGYARFLGGGDCDDGDRTIHPRAAEIPDDGIDQNCIGGDPSATQPPPDVGFVPVPDSVPADFRVLFITIDTVRADHFGMYGYDRPTSPNLDALAGQGTVFEHGWAHAPSTRYSIPAILTGRLPLDVRYDYSVWWPALADSAITIAEALAPFGFYAGAITNYSYFDKQRRMDQGMAEYDNSNARLHASVGGAGPEQTKGSSSKQQTDKAIAFVDRNADKRWFLWVHYYDPHYAYEPHPEASFGTGDEALYDGEIAFTDLQIGRLLDHLKATGTLDKTVVVVTGDHGEGFGEHDIKLHGYHLYAAQTKVPMVIRVPGLAGRRSSTPAGHADLLPTLVNLAGGKPSPEMMGRSLVEALAGRDRERVIYQQLSYENNHEMRAGADARCHVIYNVSPNTSWEVYRVDLDPAEQVDLDGSDECAQTRAEFERWYDRSTIPAGAGEALLPSRPVLAHPIDAELGDGVTLIGCEAPAVVKPGSVVEITWSFEARATIESGWKMFAHLTGPNRAFVNGDHVPTRPFEWWKPGQFIRYTTSVTLPKTAAGRYTIDAGMFLGSTRAPIKAKGARDNAVTCASFEVQP